MKRILPVILILSLMVTGCASKSKNAGGGSTAENAQSTGQGNNATSSRTLDGEIKFYPTYDSNYKTAGNEVFDFWFDIPVGWKAADRSEDGSGYTILPGSDSIEIMMYGVLKDGPEEEFYSSLSGKNGKISDFTYRDGWVGKQIDVSDTESYFVRVDGDSYMIFHVNAKGDAAWIKQNQETLNYIAMSARTTRESYGSGIDDKNTITLDELQLGEIKLDMTYDEMRKAMKSKLVKEESDEFEGLVAKTLFFEDDTQIYVVDNSVYSINVTSPDYPTPRGLKTGDTVKRLVELYGEPPNKEDDSHWGYTYDGYELFTVVIKNGKIVEIQIDVAL